MSMLAERRRKTKWVINPTKKPLWATDSNGIKFGKELMEKMGWSAGKGLGAKEQGIQEPLRVSYKNDTKGMGFKGNDDDWIEQQDEFNVLLNQLRNSDDSSVVKVSEEEKKNEIKSLEEKSRQSRARVHYQKFTRGKDLSRYSENDLACILGTNKVKKEKSKTENAVESEENTDGQLVTSFGVTTINSGSIQDYFKRKWTTDKVQSKSVSDVEKEKEEHSCDERPSFSRVLVENLNLEGEEFSKGEDTKEDGNEMSGESGEKCEKKKEKKKKRKKDKQKDEEEEPKSKRKRTSNQDYPMDEEFQNTAADVANKEIENLSGNENDCDSSRKRKKEKRKSKKDEGNDGSEEASLAEVKKKKKKERKEKPSKDGGCDAAAAAAGELTSINCNLEARCEEREGGLVKKEKKGKPGNEDLGESKKDSVEANSVVDGEFVVAKEKKKKQKHKDDSGNVGVDVDSGKKDALGKVSNFSEGDAVEVGSKKKRKKKEREDGEMERCGNENGISFETPVEECYGGSQSGSTAESEVKKKKKKKEKQEGNKIDCHGNENGPSGQEKPDGGNSSSDAVELGEVKKKKKKREEKMERQGNENGLCVEIPAESWDCGNKSNSTVVLEEVKKKNKKKEKEEGGKREQQDKENEISSEIPLPAEKWDNVNNSNSTVELDEVKKKKKKKEKEEEEEEGGGGKREHQNKENEIFSEIPVERHEVEKNSKSSTELGEPKKRKKKDKHRRKEEESGSKESGLEEGHREAVNGSSERVDKRKKRKERKGEGSNGEEQEEEEERGSGAKREKKEKKRGEEGEEERGNGGNAEVGTRAGIDRVEMICQRAAYEHVAGVHRQERVKRMIECVNLGRFRGSNLECLDGYGNSWRKCETSVT